MTDWPARVTALAALASAAINCLRMKARSNPQMMNGIKRFWRWGCNKFGRIATGIGATLMSLDVIDLNPAKPWLTNLFSEKAAERIIAGAAAFFFVLSYVRHQVVASRHPASPNPTGHPESPPPPG